MSIEAILAEDRRLVILRALSDVPQFALNEIVLRQTVDYFGHKVGRDIVRADVTYLKDHGLVRVEPLQSRSGELWLVHLTESGDDVAKGRQHPGVARRGPG
jgi:hypothetical protein